jgi:hypothetical protein
MLLESTSTSSIEVSVVEFDDVASCGQYSSSLSSLGHVLHSIPEDDDDLSQQDNESASFVGISLDKSWENIMAAFHSPVSSMAALAAPEKCEEERKLVDANIDAASTSEQYGHDDDDDSDLAALRRMYSSILEDIKNSSPYYVCKDLLVLGSPTLVPVVHQQRQQYQQVSIKTQVPYEEL